MCFTPFPVVFSVFTLNGDVVTVTTPSDCRWLLVEFRPEGGVEGEKEEERRKTKVPASGNMVSCAFLFFFFACCHFLLSSHYFSIALRCKKNMWLPVCVFLQLLCEVKRRAIEELQLQEQLQGKMININILCSPTILINVI